jgi:hypothetical protein
MLKTTVHQQLALCVTPPGHRQPGWLARGDEVIFVILDRKGLPRIRTGHIGSTGCSHCGIDNISKTVVWCDQVLNELSDNADDAYERSFKVKDPCLIKLDEIERLKDPKVAAGWFRGIYPPKVAHHISKLLSKPDFGLLDEAKGKAAVRDKYHERSEANLKHWQEYSCPHPVYGLVGSK